MGRGEERAERMKTLYSRHERFRFISRRQRHDALALSCPSQKGNELWPHALPCSRPLFVCTSEDRGSQTELLELRDHSSRRRSTHQQHLPSIIDRGQLEIVATGPRLTDIRLSKRPWVSMARRSGLISFLKMLGLDCGDELSLTFFGLPPLNSF